MLKSQVNDMVFFGHRRYNCNTATVDLAVYIRYIVELPADFVAASVFGSAELDFTWFVRPVLRSVNLWVRNCMNSASSLPFATSAFSRNPLPINLHFSVGTRPSIVRRLPLPLLFLQRNSISDMADDDETEEGEGRKGGESKKLSRNELRWWQGKHRCLVRGRSGPVPGISPARNE